MSAGTRPLDAAAAAEMQAAWTAALAEAMPRAFSLALGNTFGIARFLVNGTMRLEPADHPVYFTVSREFMAELSVPSLLALLFDKRQAPFVMVRVRDELAERYLGDEDTQALIIRTARGIAINMLQDQQLVKAEHKALFGRLVAGAPLLSDEQMAAMDETAEIGGAA